MFRRILNFFRSARLDKNFYTLIISHKNEDSVLEKISESNLIPYSVGNRKRYATCSGVAWIDINHIAVVNLYGQHLRIYRVDLRLQKVISLISELKENLTFPENLAVSPDRLLLAVTHSMSKACAVSLHKLDLNTFNLKPNFEILRAGGTFHGLDFSPDSKFLAITEIESSGYIEVIKIDENRTTSILTNSYSPLKAKSISFSKDGKYVAITYSMNISTKSNSGMAAIAFHRFDNLNGIIHKEPEAELIINSDQTNSIEDSVFLPSIDGQIYTLIVTDQNKDNIHSYEFNRNNASISYSGIKTKDVFFPHGLGLSPDSEYIAVANYGDDSLRIYKLN